MPKAGRKAKDIHFSEAFKEFLTDRAASGVSNKTLDTYRKHLHCVSLHFDIEISLAQLTKAQLNDMKMSRKVQSGNTQNNGCVDRGKILKPNGA